VSGASAFITPLLGALALGIAFNPLASLLGAPLAAGLFGSPKAGRRRHAWAACVVALAWLLGDGFRVMGRLRDALDAAGRPQPETLVLLAVWALAALLAGYAVPAALGAYVGRRVVKGTGWLSAAFVAASFSAGLVAVASPAVAALGRLAGA
jgi:hypothetical protein